MSNTEMKPVPRSLRAALALAWIAAIIWVALVSAPVWADSNVRLTAPVVKVIEPVAS